MKTDLSAGFSNDSHPPQPGSTSVLGVKNPNIFPSPPHKHMWFFSSLSFWNSLGTWPSLPLKNSPVGGKKQNKMGIHAHRCLKQHKSIGHANSRQPAPPELRWNKCFFTFHVSKTIYFSIPWPLSKIKGPKLSSTRNSSKELHPGSSTSCASRSPLDSFWRWITDHCIFQLPGEGWRSRQGLGVQEEQRDSALCPQHCKTSSPNHKASAKLCESTHHSKEMLWYLCAEPPTGALRKINK